MATYFDLSLYEGQTSWLAGPKDPRCEDLRDQILREGSRFPFVAKSSNLIDVYTALGEYANTDVDNNGTFRTDSKGNSYKMGYHEYASRGGYNYILFRQPPEQFEIKLEDIQDSYNNVLQWLNKLHEIHLQGVDKKVFVALMSKQIKNLSHAYTKQRKRANIQTSSIPASPGRRGIDGEKLADLYITGRIVARQHARARKHARGTAKKNGHRRTRRRVSRRRSGPSRGRRKRLTRNRTHFDRA